MKVKYLFIALLIALTISLVACDGDAAPAVTTVADATSTTVDSETTVATTTAEETTVATTTVVTTTSGVIELPPVDVR